MRPGPGPPGGAEPEATATAMEVEVDEEEEEATAAEVDEDEVVAWASLGGVGCCGVGCCGVGCCCGDWETPEPRWPLPPPAPPGPPPVPPRSAMARPGVRGAGVTGIEATTSGRPGFSPSGSGGGGSTRRLLSPPAGAREREAARRRGASRRAVLALARRCLLRLAPPRHWVGVSGEGAGSPGSRRPHPTPRGGAHARRLGGPVGARPLLFGRGVCGPRVLGWLLPSNPPRELQPACPVLPSPPSSSQRQRPGQRKSRFSGARPRPGGGLPRERALVPSGLLSPSPPSDRGPGPRPATRGFLRQDQRRKPWRPSGLPLPRVPKCREVSAPASLQCRLGALGT